MTPRTRTIAVAACASIAAFSAAGQVQDRAQAARAFETVREVLNNQQIADLVSRFLAQKGPD